MLFIGEAATEIVEVQGNWASLPIRPSYCLLNRNSFKRFVIYQWIAFRCLVSLSTTVVMFYRLYDCIDLTPPIRTGPLVNYVPQHNCVVAQHRPTATSAFHHVATSLADKQTPKAVRLETPNCGRSDDHTY